MIRSVLTWLCELAYALGGFTVALGGFTVELFNLVMIAVSGVVAVAGAHLLGFLLGLTIRLFNVLRGAR